MGRFVVMVGQEGVQASLHVAPVGGRISTVRQKISVRRLGQHFVNIALPGRSSFTSIRGSFWAAPTPGTFASGDPRGHRLALLVEAVTLVGKPIATLSGVVSGCCVRVSPIALSLAFVSEGVPLISDLVGQPRLIIPRISDGFPGSGDDISSVGEDLACVPVNNTIRGVTVGSV
ncbi:MAG TPA: hypothetical protein VES21_14215 [Nocardioidaceae bacterium]|nr:hypothetical protein [Nocardioidaceae bacterium]